MFRFNINYYYKNNESGNLDEETVRNATVYAETLSLAEEKIKIVDKEYKKIATCKAIEIRGETK